MLLSMIEIEKLIDNEISYIHETVRDINDDIDNIFQIYETYDKTELVEMLNQIKVRDENAIKLKDYILTYNELPLPDVFINIIQEYPHKDIEFFEQLGHMNGALDTIFSILTMLENQKDSITKLKSKCARCFYR